MSSHSSQLCTVITVPSHTYIYIIPITDLTVLDHNLLPVRMSDTAMNSRANDHLSVYTVRCLLLKLFYRTVFPQFQFVSTQCPVSGHRNKGSKQTTDRGRAATCHSATHHCLMTGRQIQCTGDPCTYVLIGSCTTVPKANRHKSNPYFP
jgi:hypothetical protein